MRVSDQLLEAFFSGRCTAEERALVTRYLADHPEKLDKYLTENSWRDFSPGRIPVGVPSERLRRFLEARVGRAPVRRIPYERVAAAAIIFLVCTVSFFYWQPADKKKSNSIPIAEPVTRAALTQPVPPISLRSIRNNASNPARYKLPDGSRVYLASHSSISFAPFVDRRDIFLEGEAVFTVAKDASKPFSVHIKNTVTTALGTIFRVNGKSPLYTRVRLFQGRVLVRKEGGRPADRSFRDVYLTPGQELVLDNERFTVQVKLHQPKTLVTENAGPAQVVMTFSRQALTDVFSRLQQECKAKIFYDHRALRNIEFTGSFDKHKETLESFLNTLCLLNELKLKKTGSTSFSIMEK